MGFTSPRNQQRKKNTDDGFLRCRLWWFTATEDPLYGDHWGHGLAGLDEASATWTEKTATNTKNGDLYGDYMGI